MRNGTLIAGYTFQSEGVEPVREVAFFTRGDGFVGGYGPATDKDGKEVFIHDSTHRFSLDEVLELMNSTAEVTDLQTQTALVCPED